MSLGDSHGAVIKFKYVVGSGNSSAGVVGFKVNNIKRRHSEKRSKVWIANIVVLVNRTNLHQTDKVKSSLCIVAVESISTGRISDHCSFWRTAGAAYRIKIPFNLIKFRKVNWYVIFLKASIFGAYG